MDLGVKQSSTTELPSTVSSPKSVIHYPSFTIEKPLGKEYGAEFSATVRVRIKNVEHGESYGGQVRHRTEIEVLSLEPAKEEKKKPAGKGLPA